MTDLPPPAGPNNGGTPPQSIGERLGLGRQWAPGPVAWSWRRVDAAPQPMYVLFLESTTGSYGFAFTGADVERFADHSRQVVSGAPGIVVPQPDLPGFDLDFLRRRRGPV